MGKCLSIRHLCVLVLSSIFCTREVYHTICIIPPLLLSLSDESQSIENLRLSVKSIILRPLLSRGHSSFSHNIYQCFFHSPDPHLFRVAFSFLLSPLFPFVYFIHMTFILSLYWLCVSSDCISCVHVFATIGNERMK